MGVVGGPLGRQLTARWRQLPRALVWPLLPLAGIGGLIGATVSALADPAGLSETAALQETYDDNALRLPSNLPTPSGESRADLSTRGSVGANWNINYGLQQFFVGANGGAQIYAKNTQFDSNFYDATGGVRWKYTTLCDGIASADANSQQSQLQNLSALVVNQNLTTTFDETGNCTMANSLRATEEIKQLTSTNGAASLATSNRDEVQGRLRLEYLSQRGSSVGVEFTDVSRDYPDRSPTTASLLATSSNEMDMTVVGQYVMSPKTSFTVQAGLADLSLTTPGGGGSSKIYPNVTIGAIWHPTPKLNLTLNIDEKIVASDTIASSYSVQRDFGLTTTYQVDDKVGLNHSIVYSQQSLFGGVPTVGIPSTETENTLSTSIGATYALTTQVGLQVSATYIDQSANALFGSFQSEAITIGLSGKF